jgi:hypothetical protein
LRPGQSEIFRRNQDAYSAGAKSSLCGSEHGRRVSLLLVVSFRAV